MSDGIASMVMRNASLVLPRSAKSGAASEDPDRVERVERAISFLASPNGTNVRKLMPAYDLPLGQFGPTWSPDGTRIAFSANPGGDLYQIYTVWADGSRLARRTFDGSNKRMPPGPRGTDLRR